MNKKVVVIGGGPAGIMAASKASEAGVETLLLEKNSTLGKKLLITGKGRCNITNNADIQGLIDNIPGNGSFLYSTFYNFSNYDLINFLNENGLKTKVERGGRVFPESDRAKDVLDVLVRYAKKCNVKIKTNAKVREILTDGGRISGVRLENGETVACTDVIIATGGKSFPGTGSNGDGYQFAKQLGHTVTRLRPSLVPLTVRQSFVKELQGLSLKNVAIKFTYKNSKTLYEDFGEMLFTHDGVSGPVILSGSRHLLEYEYRDIELHIDIKPALDYDKLDKRIQRDFGNNSRKQFKNSLDELLPRKLIPVIVNLSQIGPEKPVNQITKQERLYLVNLLKDFRMDITGSYPISEAIVTAGGVDVSEIDPSTMESKIIKGLYFAGEVLDVDGYTGGFNLTIAFSTGYTAGMSAAGK